MSGDLLVRLREVNTRRCQRWHGPGTVPWSGADWSNAMQGEAGEAGNVVKKLRRHETGTGSADNPPVNDLLAKLAEELADTVIYADLVADHYGVDLRVAIVEKFNAVSVREGFPERLRLSAPANVDPTAMAHVDDELIADALGLLWHRAPTRRAEIRGDVPAHRADDQSTDAGDPAHTPDETGRRRARCECDDAYHGPSGCRNEQGDFGSVRISPALCVPCVHCCGDDDG